MNVAELIELLNKCDQEMEVLVAGREGGRDPIGKVCVERLAMNANSQIEWQGAHQPPLEDGGVFDDPYRSQSLAECVFIGTG